MFYYTNSTLLRLNMSRDSLLNSLDGFCATIDSKPMSDDNAERILFLLKTRGPLTAAALAKALRITPMGVRQHLTRLASDGLVI
jgi:hypothetical protein